MVPQFVLLLSNLPSTNIAEVVPNMTLPLLTAYQVTIAFCYLFVIFSSTCFQSRQPCQNLKIAQGLPSMDLETQNLQQITFCNLKCSISFNDLIAKVWKYYCSVWGASEHPSKQPCHQSRHYPDHPKFHLLLLVVNEPCYAILPYLP